MRKSSFVTWIMGLLLGSILSSQSPAQFAIEDVDDDGGVTNPVDYSWRYYTDQMQRFPERIGTICYNAYLLDKAGLHRDGEMFLTACAERGSTSAMIYLALLHEQGVHRPPDQQKATGWIKRAAEHGNAIAQYHYAMALLQGTGIPASVDEAIVWLRKSAQQGQVEAHQALQALGAIPTSSPSSSTH